MGWRLFIIIVFTILTSFTALPQDNLSVQFNGGIIMPVNSSKGLSGTIQLNYRHNPAVLFYMYAGQSVWDKRYFEYEREGTEYRDADFVTTYWRDDHVLIPVFAGCRIDLHTNKLFTSFVNVEAGYSYLSYNSYTVIPTIDKVSGEPGYAPDLNTREKHNEDLYALGIGVGISHPMSDTINILLAFKLNSYLNDSYNGFFSEKGTYTMFQLGVNFLI